MVRRKQAGQQVALEAIPGEKTIAEIAAHHEVHATQVTSWKNEVLQREALQNGVASLGP